MRTTFGSTRAAAKVAALVVLGMAVCAVLVGGSQRAQAGAPVSLIPASAVSKIDARVLRETANGKSASFVVLLQEQADLSAAYGMADADARGWYVYNTLRSHAARSQAALRATLDAQRVPYKPFWVANMLVVEGDRSLVESLADRSDVRAIESNGASRWIEDPAIANFSPSDSTPDAIEWGVQNVNAPQVWAMGFTGQGIVVGNQDTGIRWTHNGLKPKYRGWDGTTANHNYNWWDAIHTGGGSCGPNTVVPCDDNGHGTHTNGTIVGDDGAGNQVGVAPSAKWIGCRNMDVGNGTPATYSECFQFFIAPTDLAGGNANPALRPHVMNNSWGCPASEGCSANTLQQIVENTQAAGIFVVVSAGNAGPNCSTVGDPPAIYAASFSVGSITISNGLSSFSSRGPVTLDGSNRRKPDISAPGSNVRSTTRTSDTSYGSLSGTSMAGPHVVGVVALLWSARPELTRQITETKTILQNSANPQVSATGVQTCGGIPITTIPNNHFGYGRVDALAAVNSVGGGTPSPTAGVGTSTPALPTVTATRTATAAPTNTLIALTSTPTAGATNTALPNPSSTTAVNSPTSTMPAVSTPTSTSVVATSTATTVASTPTGTAMAATSTPMPGVCTLRFADVATTNTFYSHIRCLACRNIIGGYPCGGPGEPCNATNDPYFRPNSDITRGQISKMVSESAGFTEDPGEQVFEDIPEGNAFFPHVTRLFRRGLIGGYECGEIASEPCVPPENRPYFRPNTTATRGQLSKIVASAAAFPEPIVGQFYTDVPPDNAFYEWIQRLSVRGVMGGYPCGGRGEPCDAENRPYFRWANTVTRGQASKITANTFFPNCQTPAQR